MNCQTLVELVTEYLEEAMPPADRRRFEEHAALCDHCVLYIEQLRVTVRTVGRIAPETISVEARASLLAAFGDWSAERA